MSTEQILTLVGIFIASAGFWKFIEFLINKFSSKKIDIGSRLDNIDKRLDLNERMILGSLYDRTKYVAEQHIARGYITVHDYDDWLKYLYTPYHDAGGDGTIDRLKLLIDELPVSKETDDEE